MIKTLYDPSVEQRGVEKVVNIGEDQKALKVAENLIKLGIKEETVAKVVEISLEKVHEIKKDLAKCYL